MQTLTILSGFRKPLRNLLLLLLCGLLLCSVPATAASRTSHGWYCMRNKEHKQPALEPQFRFIEQSGGYYIDHRADDAHKVLYLTFDAGYENGNVEKILDTLKAHRAPGAFFILDNLIRQNTDLVKRIAAEGHTVCNHTAKHKDMTKFTDKAAFAKELTALEEIYTEYTGNSMAKYYRPPEGKFSEENLQFANELGYKTIFWSFAYADWDNDKQPDPAASLEKLKLHLHPGEVLLLHPTSATNAAILDAFLTYAEQEGYRFGTLAELCA